MKKSTRAFITEARRTKNFSILDFLHGYVYMRYIYLYIGTGLGAHLTGRIYFWIVSLTSVSSTW